MSKSNERIANKIIELLADGLVISEQWRFWIPRHLSEQPEIVKVNAKRLAQGINELVETRQNEYVDLTGYEE